MSISPWQFYTGCYPMSAVCGTHLFSQHTKRISYQQLVSILKVLLSLRLSLALAREHGFQIQGKGPR